MMVNSQKPFNEKPTLVFRSGVLCCMSVYTCGVTSMWREWGELMTFIAHGHTLGRSGVEAKCCYIHAVDFRKCSCGAWHGPRACLMTLCHCLIGAPPVGTPGRAWGQSKLVSWEGKGWPAGAPSRASWWRRLDPDTHQPLRRFLSLSGLTPWQPWLQRRHEMGPLSPPRPWKVNYQMIQVHPGTYT